MYIPIVVFIIIASDTRFGILLTGNLPFVVVVEFVCLSGFVSFGDNVVFGNRVEGRLPIRGGGTVAGGLGGAALGGGARADEVCPVLYVLVVCVMRCCLLRATT